MRSEVVFFFLFTSVYSIGWSLIHRLHSGRIGDQVGLWFMRYTRTDLLLTKSRVFCVEYFALAFLGGSLLLWFHDVPFWRFVLPDEPWHWLLVPLTFAAQNAFMGLYIGLMMLLPKSESTDYGAEFFSIPWVRPVFRMNHPYFILFSSAFFEDYFFRFAVLFTMVHLFPEMSPFLMIGYVTLLFLVEQLLQVVTLQQFIMLAVGSTAVSVFGGALALITNSGLLSAMCHAAFVITYIRLSDENNAPTMSDYVEEFGAVAASSDPVNPSR